MSFYLSTKNFLIILPGFDRLPTSPNHIKGGTNVQIKRELLVGGANRTLQHPHVGLKRDIPIWIKRVGGYVEAKGFVRLTKDVAYS
jgi:hypothetical protein